LSHPALAFTLQSHLWSITLNFPLNSTIEKKFNLSVERAVFLFRELSDLRF
jgi:hypothetical protein